MIDKEYIEMWEQEREQYDAYCKDLEKPRILYEEQEKQEKRLAIQRAVVLLENNGYKVEKIS